ncbi:cytochrome b/b6 domain-containing protein [Halomonas elongata]|uniref:Cytochrome b/b6 domain-containing protein n=1 Tax=Halomonas elongata (strain ATCC 33173 / DSM 2581 / NBRC 15536 / NCIMB 2198 / 1H9) TaxID=768066 RepID=E1VBQ0_HALED|nr:cytochrome b/b6 domain-containing protein [Halomonas elongata]WBF17974.1 cytochrome b/b6 domain-containing protein [Halomonas elongata]WPU46822.1 cytochrome b/b6 domain-containing protein [Halomonas elongata DSM 2581]CBV44207.1 cytochrome domain protein [Halomonas elongata DSM 2581]
MPTTSKAPIVIKRHALFTRLWHWVNAICLVVLLMSGLQIFNAHPALYWGKDSHFDTPALSIGAIRTAEGELRGITRLGGYRFDTTGVLGVSGPRDDREIRAFPAWSTLPGPRWLAMGRQWHFLAAWIFAPLLVGYLAYLVISGQLRRRLLPRTHEWRHVGRLVIDHARLRFPRGEQARHYNLLQKLTYLLILFLVTPLMILTGLTMSPTMDAAWPWLLDLFGGRQSARTLHFICASALLVFFIVHVLLVLASGVLNNLRSMITGRYVLPPEKEPHDDASR